MVNAHYAARRMNAKSHKERCLISYEEIMEKVNELDEWYQYFGYPRPQAYYDLVAESELLLKMANGLLEETEAKMFPEKSND